jgi:hypothetical protein
MSKRFMDTDLWNQSWYIELSAESKNIWAYLERMCDCAGILKIEIPEMKRKIGCTEISISTFMKEVNRDFDGDTGKIVERNRVMYIPNKSKIWMTGFISFQYEKGTSGVNAGIPAIKGALNRLRDEDIYDYAIKEGFLRIKGECEGKTLNSEERADLIDSSEINSKGCRGSARDKDKDKDQDQEVLDFQDLNTEGEEESNVHREPDNAGLLLERTWRKLNILPEEKRLVNEYINKYGFDAVDFAFRKGVKYNKMSLAYVDAICRKRKEKADMVEYRNRDKMKLHESILQAEEQRKNGKCLTLVRDCYGGEGVRKAVGGE